MNYEKIEKSARLRKRILSIVTYTLLTIWAIAVLFPFYWMVLTSVKSYGAYNSEWIPQLYTLSAGRTPRPSCSVRTCPACGLSGNPMDSL